ncbi:hypothetical protein [Clostridium saccharobutylicum]|uniref:Uncharacterized protein n=1 Tax=Clostridium saccharobutylicum DSM 13864 TaxID=1345695 RepID=U5MVG8_CLOSA|nr:hypothetical protein [Clostridium saccharobutylicum]AGX44590.1 hypothetical protein CLSA_c36290 [Clostridium saccharobutylicum DSM 13864]AQR91881.1 hypothetical protein CLOSC_36090 [Clostridium saccharobutylicum]AQS01783.1 hypothetical protein CSACC_36140 [Clostridium saccharobutylicum]AQS11386.1 hypothetical protein CLOBY_35420 [Clostridium saccharobutylicum]AQS15766.1 hypothetical protein CLOSACC_36140 [Clostridium saccharobutylicum]
MLSKKITAALVAVGVIASTSAILDQVNIKGAFADTVKQNVVYSKDDTKTDSQDDTRITGAEEEAYKQKSLDILKNYFNISEVKESKTNQFTAGILNEKTLDELKPKEQKLTQEEYDKGEISKEKYDKQMAYIEENNSGLKDRVQKLKHGMVQTGWTDIEGHNCYLFDFNENTKELDMAMVHGELDKGTKLVLNDEQLKNTAEDFIKEHKLGDIEKPKLILLKGHRLFYEDENDTSKKVGVSISPFTGKVWGFSVKAYEELEYNMAISEK